VRNGDDPGLFGDCNPGVAIGGAGQRHELYGDSDSVKRIQFDSYVERYWSAFWRHGIVQSSHVGRFGVFDIDGRLGHGGSGKLQPDSHGYERSTDAFGGRDVGGDGANGE
jgi:hypothetical protein